MNEGYIAYLSNNIILNGSYKVMVDLPVEFGVNLVAALDARDEAALEVGPRVAVLFLVDGFQDLVQEL